YRGDKFHMIIDDVFAEQDGSPVRAVSADRQWFSAWLKHLNAKGVVVCNFISSREMKQCAYFTDPKLRQKFASAFQLTTPVTENSVGVFLKISAESAQLRNSINTHPRLGRAVKTKKLRYHIRRINAG
ncbi:hypothetical protein, partial [Kaarinaea lacus]